MINPNSPIGVIDSGNGGLTVAVELKRLFPNENIIYFADSANCPYGSNSLEKNIELSKDMLNFMGNQGVKAVAIACNTISTLIEHFSSYPFPIISIVESASEVISSSDAKKVGIIATPFTIKSDEYRRLIQQKNPKIEVFSQGSPNLATLVDTGEFDYAKIDEEILVNMKPLLEGRKLDAVVLGCTHYPIVVDRFQKHFPDIDFINPALSQVSTLMQLLLDNDTVCLDEHFGKFTLCTSGDPASSLKIIEFLNMPAPDETRIINLKKSLKTYSSLPL